MTTKPKGTMLEASEGTLTDAATIAWDIPGDGAVVKVTLANSRIMGAPTNAVQGGFYSLAVIQDVTGGRTLSWNAAFLFPADTAPTLTTTGGARDEFVFKYDGTNFRLVGKTLDT